MKVLVTGHNGYIGSVMVRVLRAGTSRRPRHAISSRMHVGDRPRTSRQSRRYARPETSRSPRASMPSSTSPRFRTIRSGISILRAPTTSITWRRSDWPEPAREAGVRRFLFASSCSLYGLSDGDDLLTEDAAFNPITPYGESKVLVERDVSSARRRRLQPGVSRNATAYGVSPRLRADIVVNSLVGYAFTTGEIRIESDGTPWRPLVHIEDISRAFLAALEAPRELIHNQAFNVGQSHENYRISEMADMVLAVVPGSRVTYAEGGGPDPRCYRVDCSRIAAALPSFRPGGRCPTACASSTRRTAQHGLTYEEFVGAGSRYLRIRHIQRLQQAGRLD